LLLAFLLTMSAKVPPTNFNNRTRSAFSLDYIETQKE